MTAPFFSVHLDTLSTLSLSEQAVYVRLALLAKDGKVRGRYADIAKGANVSLATFKRAIKRLQGRGLVDVQWRQKTPSLFLLKTQAHPHAKDGPKWYDQLDAEDRDNFLFTKRSIPPLEMKGLLKDALEEGTDIDALIFRRYVGPERQRKYEYLFASKAF